MTTTPLANAFAPTNCTLQSWANWQAGIDSDLAALSFVAAPFQPTVTGADMVVHIAAGVITTAGGITAVAAQTVTLAAAPASPNSRTDLVVVDRITGAASVVAGTAANPGVAPSVAAGKLPVAQMIVAAGTTALTNAMGADIRTTWCPALGSLAFAAPGTDNSLRLAANVLQANEPVTYVSGTVTLTASNHFANLSATGTATINAPSSDAALWNGYAIGIDAHAYAVTFAPLSADSVNKGSAGASYTFPPGASGLLVFDGATPGNWAVFYAGGGVTTAQFTALQQDVIQNYMLAAINGAWAAAQYSNGGYDAFNTDTLGGNSGTANQTYESGHYYDNPGGTTLATPLMTGYTTSGVTVSSTGSPEYTTDYAWHAFDRSNTETTFAGFSGATPVIVVDYGASTTIASYSVVPRAAGFSSRNPVAWTIDVWNGTSWVTVDSRSGQSFATLSTTNSYTIASPVAANKIRFNCTANNGDSYTEFGEITFYKTVAPANMTLVSAALSPAPATAPAKSQIDVLWSAAGSGAVINTDFTVEVTENGGTNWVLGTLVDTGITMAGGYHLLTATIALSSGGTTVQYRLKTLNNKTQQIRAVGLMTQ